MPKVSNYTRTRIEVLDKQGLPPVAILRSLKNEGLAVSREKATNYQAAFSLGSEDLRRGFENFAAYRRAIDKISAY